MKNMSYNHLASGFRLHVLPCLLFCLMLTLLCASAWAEDDFTLLVYMCGADLQYDACIDMAEMGMAENGDNVNIVILAGGAEEWEFDELDGYTRNLVTLRDGDFESITDWGWASMGSEESLLEFLTYGLKNYPARKTAVVLWDHGAGSEGGVCFDDTTMEQDGLTLVEINNVLYDLDEALGGFHIDVFGCDACMMASYEMAVMLSCYDIDYFVASEELEPGTGWYYTPWLEEIQRNRNMDTEALCRLILDSYIQGSLEEDPDSYLTLSAVNLNKIQPLQEAMENMGVTLKSGLDNGQAADIRRGRSRMYTFGSYVDGSWDMVDLGAMLDAYAHFDPDGAASARNALSDAVLQSRQEGLGPVSGLSVLIPQDTRDEFEYYLDGMDLSIYMPDWMGFVKAYAASLQGGSYTFSQTTPENLTGSGFITQVGQLFEDAGMSWCWDWDTCAYEEVEDEGYTISVGDGDYAFSALLSGEDLQYLDYAEGMMMMDISDDEMTGYVDMGLMQNNVIDWQSGRIYSLFDGSWPVFGDQMVPMYDQIRNDYATRSLIPVKVNGEYTYLVVEFREGSPEGRILGCNAGYDDSGLPIRTTTPLKEGDSIVPVYTMYYWLDEDAEEPEEMEFDGDEIIWENGMTVSIMNLSDPSGEGETLDMMFCFVLNDVFGDYTLTDIISFEL